MNAGTLTGKVELDLSSLRASTTTAVEMTKATGQAMAESLKTTASIDAGLALYELAEVSQAAAKVTRALRATSAAPLTVDAAQAIEKLDTLDRRAEVFTRDLEKVGKTKVKVDVEGEGKLGEVAGGLQKLLGPLGLLPGHMGAVAARVNSLISTLSSFGSAAGEAEGGVSAMLSAIGLGSGAIAGLGGAAAVAAPFVIGLGATMLALRSGAVEIAADMEQTTIAFTTLTGSADAAQSTLAGLKQFADTTPFQFPEVASAAKQLIAMGIDANQVTNSLRMLGDIPSGLGQPLGEMAYLFGQIRSQGRAMTQDLNQFAGRGVPIYSALAAVMHTNEVGVRAFAEQGKIGFAEIEAAMKSLTAAGGKFHGLTEAQGQSLKGLESTAADAFGRMETQIGDVLIKNLELKDSLRIVIDLIGASGPIIVHGFDQGSASVSSFTETLRSASAATTELLKLTSAVGPVIENAFGKQGADAVQAFIKWANPVTPTLFIMTKAIDALGWAFKRAKDNIEAMNFFTSGEAFKQDTANHQKFTAEEKGRFAAVRAKADAVGVTGGANDSDIGAAGRLTGGTGGGGGGSGANAAEKSAERIRQLEAEAVVTRLRAAWREYEAQMAELDARLERDLSAANNAQDKAAIRDLDRAKRAALTGKAQDDQSKALHESWQRADDADAKARADVLRAAGKDAEARIIEITERYKKAMAGKDVTPAEAAALARAGNAEIADVKSDEGKKKLEVDKANAKAAEEISKRTAEYQINAQIAVLEAQDRTQEAMLLKFDAEWSARIAAIKDDGERAAATADYAAERAKKLIDESKKAEKSGDIASVDRPQGFEATKADYNRRIKQMLHDGARFHDVENLRHEKETALRDMLPDLARGTSTLMPRNQSSPLGMATAAMRGGQSGGLPAATINPVVGFDVPAATKALVEAVRPVIRQEIQQITRGMRDRNHAAGVGGNL